MAGYPSLCIRCHEPLSEVDTAATNCPRCGEPLPQTDGGRISAEYRKVPHTRGMLSTAVASTVCLAIIAAAGVLIYHKVSGPPASKSSAVNVSAPPALASTKPDVDKTQDEGPAWSHTPIFVVRPAQRADTRPVVMLGHPIGMTDVEKVRACGSAGIARASSSAKRCSWPRATKWGWPPATCC